MINLNIDAGARSAFRLLREDDLTVLAEKEGMSAHEIVGLLLANKSLNLGPEFDPIR